MGIADDIYAQRKSEREEAREKRRATEKQFHDEYCNNTPRAMRAQQFARQVLALIDKHVAESCRDAVYEELMLNAFGLDVEIAQVPPDRDAKDAEAMRRAMTTINANVYVDGSGGFIDKPGKVI